MNVKANTKQDAIEVIFDDYYFVKDFDAVQRVVAALSKIRADEEIK